jgi:hypothetical protein
VALRNALHEELSTWHSSQGWPGQWYDDPNGVLTQNSKNAIARTRARIKSRGQQETEGKVVSELSFDFWRFLLAGHYQSNLWVPCLQKRNRIAHHEAIHQRDLSDGYDALIALCEDLHPRLGWWVDARSRVPAVLSARP